MKKLLTMLLVLALSVSMLGTAALAAGESYGEQGVWSFDADTGTLTVSSDNYLDPPWYVHKDSIQKVVYERGVQEVRASAFAGYPNLKEVSLPYGMLYIKSSAFENCTSLATVQFEETPLLPGDPTLPDAPGLIISSGAFAGCTALKELKLPDIIAAIEFSAFEGCTGLEAVHFGINLSYIRDNAFYGCSSLKDVYYNGTAADWAKVSKFPGNNAVLNAKLHFIEGSDFAFTDVKPADYYYNPVVWAVQNEVTTGTSAVTFSPADPCSRGQVVTFLWRAKGCPEPTSGDNPFVDVSPNAYYYKAVLWAVEQNITSGTGPNTFSPESYCTRAQVATFLWRAAGEPGVPSFTWDDLGNPFFDMTKEDYFYKAVLWAVSNGVTKGMSLNSFAPNEICSRGQIVTFLYRAEKLK